MADLFPGFLYIKEERDGEIPFVQVNQTLANHFNREKSEIIGRTDAQIHDNPEESKFYSEDDRWVINTGEPRTVLYEPFTPTNSGTQINLTTRKQRTEGYSGKLQLVGSSSDITPILSEIDHAISLFDTILNSTQPITEACDRITKQIYELCSIDRSFEAVAIIKFDQSSNQFRIISGFPVSHWADQVHTWKVGEGSVSEEVIRRGTYSCTNFINDTGTVRPIHKNVMSTIALRIDVTIEASHGQTRIPWGIISCVSGSQKSHYSIKRTEKLLERYCSLISNAIRVSEALKSNKEATAKFFSLLFEVHEIETQLRQTKQAIDGINESWIRVAKHLSYALDFDENSKQIKLYYALASKHLEQLNEWHSSSLIISKFMENQVSEGFECAIAKARIGSRTMFEDTDPESLVLQVISSIDPTNENISPKIEVLRRSDHKMRVAVPLVRAAVRNVLRNAIKASMNGANRKHVAVRIEIYDDYFLISARNFVANWSHDIVKLNTLQKFFTRSRLIPSECNSWGSAIILSACLLHNGGTLIHAIPESQEVEIEIRFRSI